MYVNPFFLFGHKPQKTPNRILRNYCTVHKTIDIIYIRYSNNKATRSLFLRRIESATNSIQQQYLRWFDFDFPVSELQYSYCTVWWMHNSTVQHWPKKYRPPCVDYDWSGTVNYRSDLCTFLSFSLTQIIYRATHHVIQCIITVVGMGTGRLDGHIHTHTLSLALATQ